MKKTRIGIFAITLIIAGLMITSAVSIPTADNTTEINGITVVKSDRIEHRLEIQQTPKEIPLKHCSKPLGDPEFYYEGDQIHPAFGTGLSGQYMAAYRDDMQEQIIWTYSNEDGVYYDIGGDYPSIKLWDGSRFFGTLVPDYMDSDGAVIYIFECTDPTDFETYSLLGWDWSDNGWSDILDMEIACDNSQEDWEWGFVSLVASTTYGDGVNDGPFISYQTAEDGYATISWYVVEDCAHADADIDHEKHKTYAVYDCLFEGTWELLVRVDYFNNWDMSGNLYEFIGDSNLEYPAVAANDGDVVILAETDENGNKDIICFYGNPSHPSTSYVAMDIGDERYPDVRHVEDEKFICTFVKDNTLYTSITEDAGATWTEPQEIESNVEDEYKTADITDFASKVMYEVDNGADLDIYIADLAGGANAPLIEVASISGGIGVTAVIKNVGTADATNLEYSITATGGILGMINKEESGTISNLAVGAQETIKLPMLLGLGTVAITVMADSATETVSGTQIIIYTMI